MPSDPLSRDVARRRGEQIPTLSLASEPDAAKTKSVVSAIRGAADQVLEASTTLRVVSDDAPSSARSKIKSADNKLTSAIADMKNIANSLLEDPSRPSGALRFKASHLSLASDPRGLIVKRCDAVLAKLDFVETQVSEIGKLVSQVSDMSHLRSTIAKMSQALTRLGVDLEDLRAEADASLV